MDILGILFGSRELVKIIRIFVFNPEKTFDISTLTKKIDISKVLVKKKVRSLLKATLIRRSKKKNGGFVLNEDFPYLTSFREFLLAASPTGEEVVKKMKGAGKIKLIVLAGIFIGNAESRLDLLVVGDNIKQSALDRAIKSLEADMGRELVSASFKTPEFKYRLDMHDKLVRDVLDFPHEKALNKLGI